MNYDHAFPLEVIRNKRDVYVIFQIARSEISYKRKKQR